MLNTGDPMLNLGFVLLWHFWGIGKALFFFFLRHIFELEKNGEYLSEADSRGASCVDVRQNPLAFFFSH